MIWHHQMKDMINFRMFSITILSYKFDIFQSDEICVSFSIWRIHKHRVRRRLVGRCCPTHGACKKHSLPSLF